MYRSLTVSMCTATIHLFSPPREGRESAYSKMKPKSKTTKESEPSFAATLSIKIENCRGDPVTNTINSKAVTKSLIPISVNKNLTLCFSNNKAIKLEIKQAQNHMNHSHDARESQPYQMPNNLKCMWLILVNAYWLRVMDTVPIVL